MNLNHIAAAVMLVLSIVASLPGEEKSIDKASDPPRFPFDAEAARQFQVSAAKRLDRPLHTTNSVGMELVFIPGGQFTMGPNGSTYRVSLSKPFYIGKTEVTLGQYRKFQPKHVVAGAEAEFNVDDRPAAMVSWEEARAFCRWLSEQSAEKEAGHEYALLHGRGPRPRGPPR